VRALRPEAESGARWLKIVLPKAQRKALMKKVKNHE